MERENKKRGRAEEEGEEKKERFVKKSSAAKEEEEEEEERSGHVEAEADQSNYSSSSSDEYSGLGVFDFPWLHDDDDGIIYKSEQDWNLFQDTFSSSLQDIEFTSHCNLFETTDAAAKTTTTMNMNMNMNMNISFPDYKFAGAFPFKGEQEDDDDDDHDHDLEIGNMDCSIWSPMFNQPLQHPH